MLPRPWSAALLLVVAALAAASPVSLEAQAQRRVIYASAVDEKGVPMANLGPSDFVVREDRTAREVLTVTPANDPMTIALLVDTSQAADPVIRDIRDGLTAFLDTLGTDPSGTKHQVAVITIGERPTINTDYTTDLELAKKGAQRVFATRGSGAYLLDAIIETSKGIQKREAIRPVFVAVITPGVDLSDRTYPAVLGPLHDVGASLNVMVVGRPITTDLDRMMVLDIGTKDSGGRYDNVLASSGLDVRMKQLAEELTHQYKVTYARPETLIPPDRVTISATRSGLTVRWIVQGTTSDTSRQ